VIRLWGRLSSINVRKVVFTAQLLGVPFERIDAGGEFGVVHTPHYLARNPNALVPLLEDGEVVLWESNVIVRYLGARYGQGGFYPQDLRARFDAERWMDWQQTTMNPAGRNGFLQLVRTPPERRDPAVLQASVAAIEPLWDMVEAHLRQHRFMAGDELTMADVPIACERHRWRGLPLQHPSRPHLDAWYARILETPAARGVLDLALS
jgi:glutathione S-transferase